MKVLKFSRNIAESFAESFAKILAKLHELKISTKLLHYKCPIGLFSYFVLWLGYIILAVRGLFFISESKIVVASQNQAIL